MRFAAMSVAVGVLAGVLIDPRARQSNVAIGFVLLVVALALATFAGAAAKADVPDES